MKLAIIYDPKCPKLTGEHYSSTYLDMFTAVLDKFDEVQRITDSCSAKDIEADVILIYDIHSSHHIEIDGLADHKAVKYTYFNDPYQQTVKGVYEHINLYVHKLGAKDRTERAVKRGVDFIICPYTGLYFKHIAPHLGKDADKMLFWFPPAPSVKRFPDRAKPLSERRHKILANGITWGGTGEYDFRNWAYRPPQAFFIEHAAKKPGTPMAAQYGRFLSQFAAALALCGNRIVPKYLEIPLAGCVCFAQDEEDYRAMGFTDGINCLLVNEDNFISLTSGYLECANAPQWQGIADAGRKLIEDKWTAECFADALYNHAKLKGA